VSCQIADKITKNVLGEKSKALNVEGGAGKEKAWTLIVYPTR
jgi:hypothetical protein